MNTIVKVVLALAFSSVFCVALSNAQEAPKASYQDIMRTCGAEWKESDTRKNVVKGEGSAAWNAFRVECVARKGYVTKAQKNKDMVRVPDAAKAN